MNLSETVRRAQNDRAAQATRLTDTAERENRSLTLAERTEHDAILTDVVEMSARVRELEAAEAAEARGAQHRLEYPDTVPEQRTGPSGWRVGAEAATYTMAADSPSFFRDLRHAQVGDRDAIERLARNNSETRALGNTAGTGGSAGEFAPPAWLIESFVNLARPGRVTADLFHHEPLPAGVSSVNLPKITGGTATASQTTQNTLLPQTDMTTAALSSNIVTIAGKQVVSQQLLDQSGIPFDRIVLEDLAADYARQLGTQALTGTGIGGVLRGYLTPASATVVTWTQATPTAAGFYSQLAKLQGQINATRFAPPDAVVMHPRRWAWFASFTDSTGRPLVVPTAGGFNSMANPMPGMAAGHVGSVLGMDVYTDPNLPTTLGAGTNQDVVLMFPREDIWLWESDLRAEAFTAPYADAMGVLFRCFSYTAMVPDRYLASLGQIQGSGLVTPTFAS